MTSGSSMLAIIFTLPPQFSHFSISMVKTRFRRCAHVKATAHKTPPFDRGGLFSQLLGSGSSQLPGLCPHKLVDRYLATETVPGTTVLAPAPISRSNPDGVRP